jgi:hypothetical protein
MSATAKCGTPTRLLMGAGVAASNVNRGQRTRSAPSPWRGDDAMTITRYGRYWAVYDAHGTLVCICLYKKGALEVVRRLTGQEPGH